LSQDALFKSLILKNTFMRKIVVGISGASGSIYAKTLLDTLVTLDGQWQKVGIVVSGNGYLNWELELGTSLKPTDYPFDFYDKRDFNAPFASGSAKYDTMIIIPCSMGTLGRITSGISDDLMTRAADVILKERRKLILVPRETPLSILHLENMLKISQYGGIVCPAVPSFYSNPTDLVDIVKTVTDRVLDLAGLDIHTTRWNDQ
jgi:4-hydroxy-3-polyprenylbenzoate decarboxylase